MSHMTVVLLYDQNMILSDQILKKSSTLPIWPESFSGYKFPQYNMSYFNKHMVW